MDMKNPVVISAVRTPVGRYMGALKDVEPYDLAALVLEEVIKRAGLSSDQVDEVIMGQCYGKVNVNGSGISLGHPVAASGTRVLVTMLHEMKRRGARFGLECICGGGGLGIAAVFERK
jgi:acetyl-CoA acetyltransferase